MRISAGPAGSGCRTASVAVSASASSETAAVCDTPAATIVTLRRLRSRAFRTTLRVGSEMVTRMVSVPSKALAAEIGPRTSGRNELGVTMEGRRAAAAGAERAITSSSAAGTRKGHAASLQATRRDPTRPAAGEPGAADDGDD